MKRCISAIVMGWFVCSGSVAWAQAGNQVPVATNPQVTLQIVMDASGSMNGKLADGASKLSAARSAIQTMVTTLPDSYAMSLRVYGHRSPTSAKNCRDTEMLVDVSTGARTKRQIITSMRRVEARGYTPISLSLTKAGEDLSASGPGNRVIVLVSDGRERCEGDPCVTARRLAASDPRLVIHAVGFAVGTVARSELNCVARAGRGRYFNAQDAAELSQRLADLPPILAKLPPRPQMQRPANGGRQERPASNAVLPQMSETRRFGINSNAQAQVARTPRQPRVIVVKRDQPGSLTVEPAGDVHRIIDPDTSRVVAAIGATKPTVQLPAGTYNISFGNGLWRSVEVKSRKLTTLRPAVIVIEGASITGHPVVDTETGEVLATLTASDPRAVLIPTVVGVKFGPVVWSDVVLEEGKTRVLKPGILTVKGANDRGHILRTNTETVVSRLTIARPTMPLPPGNYSLQVDGKRVPFSIREDERLIVEVR